MDLGLVQLAHGVRDEVAEDDCKGDTVHFNMLLDFVEDVGDGEVRVQARLQLYFSKSDPWQEEEYDEHVYVRGDANNVRLPKQYVNDPVQAQIVFEFQD